MLRVLIIAFLLPFPAYILFSGDPVVIYGTVSDSETGEPIENVNIMLTGTSHGAASDRNGNFIIENIPPGTYRIEFSHINYIPLGLTQIFIPGIEKEINTELQQRPIPFEKIEVVETIEEERFLPDKTGYLISRRDIERSGAVSLGDIINRFVPRSIVRETGGNLYIQLQLRTTIAQRYDRRDPFPLVILDDMPVGRSPVGLANIVTPSEVELIRVVRPPDAEALYGSDARHGAIIIRTIETTEDDIKMSPLLRRLVVGGLISIFFYLAILH